MNFSSLGGSNAARYASAGKAVADSAAAVFQKQRATGPDYAGLNIVAMKTQTDINKASIQARANLADSAIKAVSAANQGKLAGERLKQVGSSKTSQRMAGILPAIGQIVGSAFEKEPKRIPPSLAVEPVKPERIEYPTNSNRPKPPVPTPLLPIPSSISPSSSGTNATPSAASAVTPPAVSTSDNPGIRIQAYNYMTQEKGLSRNKALGLIANIDRESGWNPSIRSGDDGGPGGLFQWKGSRQTPTVSSLVNSGDWRGQIDYALNEPGEPYSQTFQQTTFDSPQSAADGFMTHFERPLDTRAGSKRHSQLLGGYGF